MSQNSILELEFKTDTGLGNRANIGIIVLRTDQTLEHEFANLLNLAGVALYHSRIPNEMEVTKENLANMEEELPVAAALLPALFNFDVIGYGCTSGSTIIGEKMLKRRSKLNIPMYLPQTP